MPRLTLDLPDPVSTEEARLELAITLFRSRRVTLSEAAQLAGIARAPMIEVLTARGVPIPDADISDPAQEYDRLHRSRYLPYILAGATFLLVLAVLVGLPLWIIVVDARESAGRMHAMNRILSVIEYSWRDSEIWTLEEREEMIRERAQSHVRYVNVYRARTEDHYLILVIPNQNLGDAAHIPKLFLSKGEFDSLERVSLMGLR